MSAGRPTKLTPEVEGAPQRVSQGKPDAFPEWAETAWRLHLRVANYAEVARVLRDRYPGEQISHDKVRRWVPRFAAVVRAARDADAGDALEQYVAEVQEVKQQAWADHRTADNANAKAGNLKIILDCAEKEAAAKGVVTERKASEHSGPGGGPLEVAVGTVSMDELMADDEGRALLSRIATRLCPRNGDAAHAGDEAD